MRHETNYIIILQRKEHDLEDELLCTYNTRKIEKIQRELRVVRRELQKIEKSLRGW